MFLKECKYIEKEKKSIIYINCDVKISYYDSDKEKSDKENWKRNEFTNHLSCERRSHT